MYKKPRATHNWLVAVLIQMCWLSAAHAGVEPNSQPSTSNRSSGSASAPPSTQPATTPKQGEEAQGIPVLEGGPKPAPIKPGRPAKAPAGGIEAKRQTPESKVPDATRTALVNAKLKLHASGGTQEFEEWVENLSTGQTAVHFRWSSQPAVGEVMWAVMSEPSTPFRVLQGENGPPLKQQKNVLLTGIASKPRFSIDFAAPPISAKPDNYSGSALWVGIFLVDENKRPMYSGNKANPTVESKYVRVNLESDMADVKPKVWGACTSDSDCRDGKTCVSGMCAQKIDDTPKVEYCNSGGIYRVDNTYYDCSPYACRGPETPYPEKGTPGAACLTYCNQPWDCAPEASCKQFQCVLD